jgi:Asp-tRNA(Asn)/Glu-tRNA(Gln) amidotransferase A subunit family amidase
MQGAEVDACPSRNPEFAWVHCPARAQVSLPVAEVDGCPLGLGVIGPRGSDEDLLRLGELLMELLPKPGNTKSA